MRDKLSFPGWRRSNGSAGRARAALALTVVVMGCLGPAGEEQEFDPFATPIPDSPITEAEMADGVDDPGTDRVEPYDGIDGNVADLAPPASDDGRVDVAVDDPISQTVQGVSNCRNTTGYRAGRAISICVTTVDGKLVEYRTAAAYLRMKAAARRAGVGLYIVSGFRTMERQRELYNCWVRRVPGCNLAARPGYSNHQSGLALDLNTSSGGVYRWLTAHGREYGFRRTVPSEAWHWEYAGGGPGPTPAESQMCHSGTLNRNVGDRACVESRFDHQWYQCVSGTWRRGREVAGRCSSSYALNRGGNCFSETLQRRMDAGACVQSRADRRWYQCTNIGWVADDSISRDRTGPVGSCSSMNGL